MPDEGGEGMRDEAACSWASRSCRWSSSLRRSSSTVSGLGSGVGLLALAVGSLTPFEEFGRGQSHESKRLPSREQT